MNLVTLPSHEYLNKHGIPYERVSFPTSAEKGAAGVANALGLRQEQAVKTLIFESGTGEHVLVMLPANRSAKSGLLKKAIGNRNIKMADPETVIKVTGYPIGSIPPFHWQPEGFRTFIEASLMKEAVLGVGTGQWGEEIMITPENLVNASNALIVVLVEV